MAHTENFIPVKLDGKHDAGQIIKPNYTLFEAEYMIAKVA